MRNTSGENTMNEFKAPITFSSDRPITELSEDLLGRKQFCYSLADAIRNWHGEDSLVFAVAGKWGYGKTSAKNLIVSLLKKSDDGPAVIEFNPWNWTGEDRILSAFFEEIGIALGSNHSIKGSEDVAKRWSLYASRLSLGSKTLEHVRTVTELFGVPWAPLVLGGISKSLSASSDVVEEASRAAGQSIEGLKARVAEALAKLDRPILIVLDDVDRLTNEEIRLLFRIVKTNADFPNLVFFLLYDSNVISTALDNISGQSGREYLEKIVQASFDLPRINQSDIDRTFFAGLDALFANHSVASRFESDRWQGFYRDAVRPFLASLRDVRRYLSMFSFELGMFYQGGVLDVNFIDLVGVELLRVFEPNIYRKLPELRPWLINDRFSGLTSSRRDGHTSEEIVAHINEVVGEASPRNADAVLGVIANLFPKIEWGLKRMNYGVGFEHGWERSLRICHFRTFDRYFARCLPEGEVPIFVLELICQSQDREELLAALEALEQDGMIEATVERLEAFKDHIGIESRRTVCSSLLSLDSLIGFDSGMALGMSPGMALLRTVGHCVRQYAELGKREEFAAEILEDATGVWLPVRFVALFEDREEDRADNSLFSPEGDERMRNICVKKILASKLTGLGGGALASCLYRWRDWAGNEGPSAWCRDQAKEPSGALKILRAFTQTSHVSGGHGTSIKHFVRFTQLKEFVDIDSLIAIAPSLFDAREDCQIGQISDEEGRMYRRDLERFNAGQPDDWQD